MSLESWNTGHAETVEWTDPTADDVNAAFARQDACIDTILSLNGEGELYLMVGGGQGRYVVTMSTDEGELWTMIPGRSGTKTLLAIGGQEGDFNSELIANSAAALQAALYFLEHGKRDPRLMWVEEAHRVN